MSAPSTCLRAWRKSQGEEAELVGRRVRSDDPVFARPDGEPIHPDYSSEVIGLSAMKRGVVSADR